MFTKKQVGLLAAALASVSFCTTAFADGVPAAEANLAVTAGIDSQCIINSVTDLAFGDYRPISTNAGAVLAGNSGRVSVTCTTGSTSPKILMGQGENAVGGSDAAPARRMKANTSDFLAYFLYQDESQTVWGNTSGTGKAVTTDGFPHVETIYGELAAGQNKPVGQYADTVVVSVVF